MCCAVVNRSLTFTVLPVLSLVPGPLSSHHLPPGNKLNVVCFPHGSFHCDSGQCFPVSSELLQYAAVFLFVVSVLQGNPISKSSP